MLNIPVQECYAADHFFTLKNLCIFTLSWSHSNYVNDTCLFGSYRKLRGYSRFEGKLSLTYINI